MGSEMCIRDSLWAHYFWRGFCAEFGYTFLSDCILRQRRRRLSRCWLLLYGQRRRPPAGHSLFGLALPSLWHRRMSYRISWVPINRGVSIRQTATASKRNFKALLKLMSSKSPCHTPRLRSRLRCRLTFVVRKTGSAGTPQLPASQPSQN